MKKKHLKLSLNKQKVSELTKANQDKIIGGTYPTCFCPGGGVGSNGCTNTCAAYSCACSLPGGCL